MEKKVIARYVFLMLVLMALSVTVPSVISHVSGLFVSRIISSEESEAETEEETQSEKTGSYTIGNPEEYQDSPKLMDPEMQKSYEKYDAMVKTYSSYVREFSREVMHDVKLAKKEVDSFLNHDSDQFYEVAASFAYNAWGTQRTIRALRFDSIISYTDDEGRPILQAMVEFLHTSHPESETADQVVCIYYKNEGFYYFP